jgi:putative ABC transport system permease protein
VSSLGVFLTGMDATPPPRPALQAAWPKLTVQTWLDQARSTAACATSTTASSARWALIIGVIVVFVVTNAMAMAIIERTREIGTLRALGTCPAS